MRRPCPSEKSFFEVVPSTYGATGSRRGSRLLWWVPPIRNASNGDGNGGLVSALFSFVILVAMVGEQEIICVGGGSRS